MTTATAKPATLTGIDPIEALSDFERAFLNSGTRAEINRFSRMVLPFVNAIAYEVKFVDCDCVDLQVWHIPDHEHRAGWFYAICHEHRLQPIGRANRCSHQAGAEDRTHRRRKSGYTTERWHEARS